MPWSLFEIRLIARLALLTLFFVTGGGCSWLSDRGPVSKEVATCRQLTSQGALAMERGDVKESQEFFRRAVQTCQADVDARRQYAQSLWSSGQHQAAIGQLEIARSLDQNDAWVVIRVGEMYRRLGKYDLALKRAEEGIDLVPSSHWAWSLRADVLREQDRPEEAIADYLRALGLSPNDPKIMLDLAELYMERERPQRALTLVQGLLEIYPVGGQPQSVLDLQGQALTEIGRHVDAVESFQLAIKAGEPSPDLLFRKAEAEFLVGDFSAANESAHHALAMDYQHRGSRELVDRIQSTLARKSQPSHY